MLTAPIKVLLVESQAIVLAGLQLLIDSDARFVVCGAALNRDQALAQSAQQQPDVIVLGLDLGEDHGLFLIPALLARCQAKVLVLTGNKDLRLHDQAVFQGARGVILKDEPAKSLFEAIAKIYRGGMWLDHQASSRFLLEIALAHAPEETSPEKQKLANLSKTEKKVLESVVTASDKPLKLVAEALCISQHTLRNHLAAIYDKLGISSRLELYIFYKDHSTAPSRQAQAATV